MEKEIEKDIEKQDLVASDDSCWFLLTALALVFGFGTHPSQINELDKRISVLEAKNEIIEKIVIK